MNYTKKLSAIISISKLLVLSKAYYTRTSQVTLYARQYQISEEEARENEEIPSFYTLVQASTNRFLLLNDINKQAYPFDWIIRLRSYGLKIRYNYTSSGQITWKDDEISLENITIDLTQIRSIVAGLIDTLTDCLYKQLLFVDNVNSELIPEINLETLRDNISNDISSFNFIEKPLNSWLINGSDWLVRYILYNSDLYKHFFDARPIQDDSLSWKNEKILDFFKKIKYFKEILFVTTYITSGGPPRSKELFSIRYYNTVAGGLRNIFLENGLVSLVTTYHKGFALSGQTKVINRYLPYSVSKLLVYYLWLVKPFENFLENKLGDKRFYSTEKTSFLWPLKDVQNKVREEKDSSDSDQSDKSESPRRAGRAGPKRKKQRQSIDTRDFQLKSPNIYNEWTSTDLSKLLKREFSNRLSIYMTSRPWRHIFVAITRKYYQKHEKNSENKREIDYSSEFFTSFSDEIYDLQMAHSTNISIKNYGRLLNENPIFYENKRARFRDFSYFYHGFLRIPTRDSEELIDKYIIPRDTKPISIELAQFKRLKRLKSLNLKYEL